MAAPVSFNRDSRFPAIALYAAGDLTVFEAIQGFVICRRADLRSGEGGRFARATIVDCNAIAWEVEGAEKPQGGGLQWNLRLFLNRNILVQPRILLPPKPADIKTVRPRVVEILQRRGQVTLVLQNFCTVVGHREAEAAINRVQSAASIVDIISILVALDFPEKHRGRINSVN
jgi:hypothetical protein